MRQQVAACRFDSGATVWSSKMRRVVVRDDLCIGCGLCRVFCEAHHAGNDDPLKALKHRHAPPAGGIRVEQSGPQCISVRCRHCDDAPCIDACLTGAMHRDEESCLVLVDDARCIGCGTCMLVCPYGAIRKDEETNRAVKCDGCLDRDVPRCVSVCPNGALVTVEQSGVLVATPHG
jgi:carbon-monoxide dehydrogenase iron sulfur subunit